MATEKNNDSGKVEYKLKWQKADLPTIHVNQMLITHAGPEFYLIFGEVIPIDLEDVLEIPKTLEVIPRVRVAIPREMMGVFVSAIDDNYERFVNKITDALARAEQEESDGTGSP